MENAFLVAERGGGMGGLDLYVASKTKKGWSRLENLGDKVNTAAHEGFPFAASNNKLYFCSKGHPGYGGYDIFVTEQDTATGEWKIPKNIGLPFNSPYDDISICFDATNSRGAFTSTRGLRGDDLFLFTIDPALAARQRAELAAAKLKASQSTVYVPKIGQKAEVKTVETASVPVPKVEQKVETQTAETAKDAMVSTPKLEAKTTETASVSIQKVEQKTETPRISISADPPPKSEIQNPKSEDPSVKTAANVNLESKNYYDKQLKQMIETGNLPENRSIVIDNINYSTYAATDITPDLALALDRIAEFLAKNRRLSIEINAHTEIMTLTDSRAKQISTTRAENVVKYLVAQGVNAKRISAQGLGRVQPLKDCKNGNCTPEEDEKNRRMDVKINGSL